MNNISEGDIKSEPQFVPISIPAARESNDLVWWRPDGILTEYPESDAAMVRVG